MRLSRYRYHILLLLLSNCASAASTPAETEPRTPAAPKPRYDVGTKDAPVDGKDGKPHEGPFVDTTNRDHEEAGSLSKDLPPLEGRPEDPTVVDGKKIPDVNDGVMDDRNREMPKEGTTGTEGGVSEKDKQRLAQEGQTGEKIEHKPETPKEAPPLPHSEEDRMPSEKESETKSKDGHVPGLEKPEDLPDRLHDDPQPLPGSANKDHLDLSADDSAGDGSSRPVEDSDGIIQPFHSFILSFAMIIFSEIGDKTFLVAALMAMKHDRMVVFSAAFGALLVMTVLSAVLGHALPTLIPKRLTSFAAAGLFLVFGAKLLREGMAMSPDDDVSAEMHEVEQEISEKEKEAVMRRGGTVSSYTLEMGLNGRKSRSRNRFPTPHRSPSTSPAPTRRKQFGSALDGINNLLSLLLSPAWVQTFVMTFLGEWGDRSQIATIAMAAGQDYWWVTFGAMLGHCICTGIAVIGGRAIAGRVSLKVVTIGGAVAFLVFGVIYLFEAFYV